VSLCAGVPCGCSNFDEHEPRKGLIVSFVAADVLFSRSLGGIYAKQQDSYRAMHAALKAFAPGREHIVPTGEEGHEWPTAPSHTHNGTWAASDIAEKWWPELFLPGETFKPSADRCCMLANLNVCRTPTNVPFLSVS
jgi:hypothetical protein